MRRRCVILSLFLCSPVFADIPLRAKHIVSGPSLPIFVAQAPGDSDRLFIVEQAATPDTASIRVFKYSTGTLNKESFMTLTGLQAGGESGLLGLAFDPNYATNGHFYLNYMTPGGSFGAGVTQIARFTRTSADSASMDSRLPILTFDQPQDNHNGGWLGFSPIDGKLYVNTGDGGGGNDEGPGHTPDIGNALDTSKLLGKVLRLDVSGDDFPQDPERNYRIPADNPFRDPPGGTPVPGADEIWSYGLRNPWRSSFDRVTGDLYIGDVGQGAREEINFQPGNSAGGENYGWRAMEGELETGLTPAPPSPPRVDPIHTYVNPTEGIAVSGGYVYRGSENDAWVGTYIFGDYGSGRIWSFVYDGTSKTKFRVLHDPIAGINLPTDAGNIGNISSFGEDNLGRLYIVSLGGSIHRLVPAHPGDADLNELVEVADLGALATNWQTLSGATWAMGDFTDDGMIDVADLGILATNWQTGPALIEALKSFGLPTIVVPEPAVILILPIVAILARRRASLQRRGLLRAFEPVPLKRHSPSAHR
jgi:glucose/arabinose dehydrogenase